MEKNFCRELYEVCYVVLHYDINFMLLRSILLSTSLMSCYLMLCHVAQLTSVCWARVRCFCRTRISSMFCCVAVSTYYAMLCYATKCDIMWFHAMSCHVMSPSWCPSAEHEWDVHSEHVPDPVLAGHYHLRVAMVSHRPSSAHHLLRFSQHRLHIRGEYCMTIDILTVHFSNHLI